MLLFFDGSEARHTASKFERRHWTEVESPFFVRWHDRVSFLSLPEKKRRLYVATPVSWKGFEPCRALAALASLVFTY